MNKILNWYIFLNKWPQIFLRSIFISIPFYFAAYLSNSVSEAAKTSIGNPLLVHTAVYLVLLTFVTFISIQIKTIYDNKINLVLEQKQNIYHAYALVERVSVKEINSVKKQYNLSGNVSYQTIVSLEKIQDLITATYNTFESLYGSNSYNKERIDFEVTFMTKSYLDGKITIPASENRDGRSPRSMLLRKDNPEIYSNTVTAHIYRAIKPNCQIINNTSMNSADYYELYAGQKDRIKSTIVYPILSCENELLGTLVVHCDKIDFFLHAEQKYWIDLLEVFSKSIAVEKIKLDIVYEYLSNHDCLTIEFDENVFF